MSIDAMFETRSQIGRSRLPPAVRARRGRRSNFGRVAMARTDEGAEHGDRRIGHHAVALERDARRRAHRMFRHAGPLSHRCAGAQDHSDIAMDAIKAAVRRFVASRNNSRQRSGSAVASARHAAVRFSSFPCRQSLAARGGLCSGRGRFRAVRRVSPVPRYPGRGARPFAFGGRCSPIPAGIRKGRCQGDRHACNRAPSRPSAVVGPCQNGA